MFAVAEVLMPQFADSLSDIKQAVRVSRDSSIEVSRNVPEVVFNGASWEVEYVPFPSGRNHFGDIAQRPSHDGNAQLVESVSNFIRNNE